MAGKDWGDLGQDLNRLIEDAIHVGDFRRLNDNIRGVFDQTFCGMENRKGNGENGNWEFDLSGNSQPGKLQIISRRHTVAAGRAVPGETNLSMVYILTVQEM